MKTLEEVFEEESKVFFLMYSGSVERFHTMRKIKSQNIAEHSWGVAVLADYIFGQNFPNLVRYALYHDAAEIVTGDTPATAKWESEKLERTLSKLERDVCEKMKIMYEPPNHLERDALKICDLLELMFYCSHEFHMGNKFASEPFKKVFYKIVYLIENPDMTEVSQSKVMSILRELNTTFWENSPEHADLKFEKSCRDYFFPGKDQNNGT